MAKHCVLVSGRTIAHDQTLREELKEFAVVLTSDDNAQIESILSDNKIDLIILEIASANLQEVEVIRVVKTKYPDTEIVLVDGDANQEVVAQAFAYGAKDAFHKPFKICLIAERAHALLRRDRF
jgi:DNA-binding response OmpR family regulator